MMEALQQAARDHRRPTPFVAYDRSWPDRFEAIRRRLASALAATFATIDHVGSTAVPGLAAEPIMDIAVVVKNPADVPAADVLTTRCCTRPSGLDLEHDASSTLGNALG